MNLYNYKFFITGAAGFIGSNLIDRLLENGAKVVGYDNLSTGQIEFLNNAGKNQNFNFFKGDILDIDFLTKSMNGCDFVIHFAANADIKEGLKFPQRDLEQNTIGTFNVLNACRVNNIKKLAFSSTGSVYGDAKQIPTPENAEFPVQTSLYAASKLAGEGLIQAFSEGYGIQSYIFRFVSILGERYTHGHVFDFYKKILDNPNTIEILGNGEQKKSYLYVQDCVAAILHIFETQNSLTNIFNLGTDQICTVNQSLTWICDFLNVNPKRLYTGGARGWVGDNPHIHLSIDKLKNTNYSPKLSIKESILKTLVWIQTNEWIYEKRA